MTQSRSTKTILMTFSFMCTLMTSPLFCMFGYENVSDENDMNAGNVMRVQEPLKKKLKLELHEENELENCKEIEQKDRAQKFENALISIRNFNFKVLEIPDQELENLYHELMELGLLELRSEQPYVHFSQDQLDTLSIDWIMEQSSLASHEVQQVLKIDFISALQFLEKTIRCFEFRKIDPEVTFEDGSKKVIPGGGETVVQALAQSIAEMIKKYQ